MIEFKQKPPKSVDDVVLADSGIAILRGAMRPNRVTTLFGERAEKSEEIGPRLALLGTAVRATILASMDETDRPSLLTFELAGGVAEQFRSALTDDAGGELTPENRNLARYFAIGLGGYAIDEPRKEAIL